MGRGGEVAPSRNILGEGDTPLTLLDPAAIAAAGLPPVPDGAGVWLKHEWKNPTGSHKDRAAAHQLRLARAAGVPGVTISSSGNAGIATSAYAAVLHVPAVVCVHPDTDPAKLAAIDAPGTLLVVTPRAINTAKVIARELGMPNLRPSVNDDALAGYATLGDELAGAAAGHRLTDIVLFATSGATAQAVAERVGDAARVHFVQGEGNAALADPDSVTTDASAHGAAAGRLGVRRSRRARTMLRAVAATGGSGHVASADDVAVGRRVLDAAGVPAGDESSANVAVALRLAAAGARVACVVSGAPVRSAAGVAAGSSAPPGGAPPAPPLRRIDVADEHEALARVREALAIPVEARR